MGLAMATLKSNSFRSSLASRKVSSFITLASKKTGRNSPSFRTFRARYLRSVVLPQPGAPVIIPCLTFSMSSSGLKVRLAVSSSSDLVRSLFLMVGSLFLEYPSLTLSSTKTLVNSSEPSSKPSSPGLMTRTVFSHSFLRSLFRNSSRIPPPFFKRISTGWGS